MQFADIVLAPAKRRSIEEQVAVHLTGAEALVAPRCRFFEACGGCHLQHLAYPDQLAYKARMVRAAFAAQEVPCPLAEGDVIGMDDPWNYRNKADFNVKVYGGELRIGFTEYGSRHVLDVDECPIVSRPINAALGAAKETLGEFPELKRKLHSIVLRSSSLDDKVVVLYHTKLKEPAVFSQVTARMREKAPQVAGGGYLKRGKSFGTGELGLRERIAGVDFRYSPPSFFQANPVQTEALCRAVEEYADPHSTDVVIDVYSGVGLFTLVLAPSVHEVYAVEDTPTAVKDAQSNAQANGITNCRFLRGQAEERLVQMGRFGIQPTLAVVDPPRSGCSPRVLRQIATMPVPRVVYVSCNPTALARDVKLMTTMGYRIEALTLVDMFPQTLHCECVALLRRA